MADEKIGNGVAIDGDDQGLEQEKDDFYDFDRETEAKISELNNKIQGLEQEKDELVTENEEKEHRIKKLTVEIGEARRDEAKLKKRIVEMEVEIERAQSDKTAAEATAERMLELENEVAKLQRDLESAISNGDKANSEILELKKLLEEKESSLEIIQRDKELAKQGVNGEIEEVMKANFISKSKVSELEKRLEGMQAREREAGTEKAKLEEDAQIKIYEKEKEVSGMKEQIGELEAVVARNELELEMEKKAKKEIEISLGNSKEKVKEMETKLFQLQEEAEQAEKVISGLKEKTVKAVNGISSQRALEEDDMKEVKGLNSHWPTVAATGTAIVLAGAAVCYLHYAKRRYARMGSSVGHGVKFGTK